MRPFRRRTFVPFPVMNATRHLMHVIVNRQRSPGTFEDKPVTACESQNIVT